MDVKQQEAYRNVSVHFEDLNLVVRGKKEMSNVTRTFWVKQLGLAMRFLIGQVKRTENTDLLPYWVSEYKRTKVLSNRFVG